MRAPAPSQYPPFVLIGPGGAKYRLVWVRGRKWLGDSNSKKRRIRLNRDQPRAQLFLTFLHECLHAIEFEDGIKVKHKVIHQFEFGLYWLLRENIDLFRFAKRRVLTKKKKQGRIET